MRECLLDDRILRVPAGGGEHEPLTEGPGFAPKWSADGRNVYFAGIFERANNLWVVSIEDGIERPVTELAGRPGRVGFRAIATDGRDLYFTWQEDVGDIWVMDVVQE